MVDLGAMINAWRCRRLSAALVDYSEGMLAGRARARVEQHVAGCTRCAATLAAFAEVPALLQPAIARRDETFWAAQRQRVMQAVRAPVLADEVDRARGFDWRLAMPVAVALVVALAGYLSLRPPAVPGAAVLDMLSPDDLAALSEVSGGIVAAPDLTADVDADPGEVLEGAVEAGWIRIEPDPAWADLDDADLDELKGITG